jgi:hypothetical protein
MKIFLTKLTDLLKTNKAPASLVVADEGRPSHTFLNGADDCRSAERGQSLITELGTPGLSDIDFEPEKIHVVPREVDFS